jgi:uncharacterized membrane-anchored protein YitT (DUF2179 family)
MRTEKHTQKVILLVIWGLLTAVLLALSWFHFAWQYLGITGIPKNITNNFSSSWEAYSYFLQRLRYRRINLYLVTIGGLLVKLSCTY